MDHTSWSPGGFKVTESPHSFPSSPPVRINRQKDRAIVPLEEYLDPNRIVYNEGDVNWKRDDFVPVAVRGIRGKKRIQPVENVCPWDHVSYSNVEKFDHRSVVDRPGVRQLQEPVATTPPRHAGKKHSTPTDTNITMTASLCPPFRGREPVTENKYGRKGHSVGPNAFAKQHSIFSSEIPQQREWSPSRRYEHRYAGQTDVHIVPQLGESCDLPKGGKKRSITPGMRTRRGGVRKTQIYGLDGPPFPAPEGLDGHYKDHTLSKRHWESRLW
eukprot:TRINITY_DN16621_c0_g1_i1.p1 TRINITY_DN16621_c0_g1~~TRINITY_DN16621_c0_g1_i1.p1  ORF type:complete len:298 (+),score=39.30 TRINITY_DN16621_c0_g1_i1:82-894(+)